jgi:hypothetical protein
MNHNIVYSDRLVAFARHNGKFVELVEKTGPNRTAATLV